jgi:menin
MRDEDRLLFPLPTIGAVVQLFRHQLTGQREPDLALLSIVAGCVENTMTTPRSGGLSEVSQPSHGYWVRPGHVYWGL